MVDQAHCSRCGSDEIVPRARMIDRGDSNARHDLQVEVRRKPNAVLFKGAERSSIFAQLCAACGHVELFAETPRALYAAYVQADASTEFSALEELERTREALAESQIQLHDLEEKLAFLDQLLERKESPTALPKTEP